MKRIVQANIDRFKQLLKTEGDLSKRAMLLRLLAEQEIELKKEMKRRFLSKRRISSG